MVVLLIISTILGILLLSRVAPIEPKYLNFFTYQYFIQFILLVVPGTILILNGNREDLALYPVSDQAITITSLAVCWCVFMFSFTLYILDLILNGKLKNRIKQFKFKEVYFNGNPKIISSNITLITITNFILLCIFLYLLPSIPLFHIGLGAELVMNSRLESAFDLPAWLYGFRRVLVYFFPIFLLYVIAVNHSVIKISKYVLGLCWLNSLLILGYSSEKAPVIYLLISVVILKNTLLPEYKINLTKLLFMLFIIFLLLLTMFVTFYDANIIEALDNLKNRIFLSQIAGSFLSVEYYGNIGEYKYFSSILFRVYSLLGYQITMQPSEELVFYYYPELYNNNLWRNVNSFIIQGAWANFGIIGIIFAPVWVATIFYIFMYKILSLPKRPENVAIYAYSTVFMVAISTNFNNFIYSSGFILTLIIWIFLRKI